MSAVQGRTLGRRVHYGYLVLALSVLVVMGALGFARFGYTMILPSMREGLGLNYTEMGMLATGNFLGYVAFAFAGGFLASRFGPRLVISLSLFVTGIAMVATGLALDFWSALAMRTLTGIGSGGSNVPVMGLLAAWVASHRRGLAAGAAVAGSSLGLMVTGVLVPAIVSMYGGSPGWRVSWYALGAAVAVVALASHLFLRNHPSERDSFPLGQQDQDDPPRGPLAAEGAPSWPVVYRSRLLWQLGAVYFAFGFSYIIYATFFAAYLTQARGWSAAAAGGLWSQIGLFSLASGIIWGSVSDRWGRKVGLFCVYSLQAVSFLVFALVPSAVGYYLSALLFALTAWSIPAIMAAACGDLLGARLAPAALGMITVVFGLGQAIGPSVAGALVDYAGSFAPGFLVAGMTALLGALGSITLRTPAQRTAL